MDLIDFSDGANSFRMRVLGRRKPGVLPYHDLLDAEIIVESSFVSGRLDTCFSIPRLDAWSVALGCLLEGRDAAWLDKGDGPVIKVRFLDADNDLPTVFVEDATGSGTTVSIPIALEEGWVGEQRARLEAVLRTWPSEVVQTSSGSYVWRH